jgi:hypothetical protein
MKKLIILLTLVFSLTASAQEMWSYAMQLAIAPDLASESGSGAGWYVSLVNNADQSELASTSVAAWNANSLYVLGWNTPAIEEGLDVFYRIYNDTVLPSGSYSQIDSQTVTLQDLSAGYLPGANNVTLDFTGQTWQAVPEPASVGLISLGGLLAILYSRKQRSI